MEKKSTSVQKKTNRRPAYKTDGTKKAGKQTASSAPKEREKKKRRKEREQLKGGKKDILSGHDAEREQARYSRRKNEQKSKKELED